MWQANLYPLSNFSYPMTNRLLFWLTIKALAMAGVIFYAGIGLGPDEAQYWTWSQALDWGYYSKPPGIAWQIWLGTQIFSQTEWGVRSLSVLLAFLQALAVYRLGLGVGLRSGTAFWCGLLMAFCPLGILGSLFAITDGGMLLCWTGACLTAASALHHKGAPDPLRIGGWILAGALFKWPIYLFWFFFLICRHWYFPLQSKIQVLKGFLLSLLGLLPSIWWNWTHDWATFRHVSATLQGGNGHQASGNFGEFLGAQALLLSPFLFVLLLLGLWQWLKRRERVSPPIFFCGLTTFVILGAAAIVACFQKVQGNWIVFAYPTGLIILGWDVFEQHSKRAIWTKIGLGVSIGLTLFVLALPSLYTMPGLSSYALAFRHNPLKHNLGWAELRQALQKLGYDPNNHFLFSDKYQTTSILSFYNEGRKRAYFVNINGVRNNQFSYWPSLQEEQKGSTGYFVWVENMPYLKLQSQAKKEFYQSELQRYFERVDFLELAPLVYEGTTIVKAALIYRCEGCKDVLPQNSNLY